MLTTTTTTWTIGQEVTVEPRTWPGINKPGGHGKIVKIHYSSLGVVDGLDVKYTLCNRTDTHLEAGLVTPHVELDRGGRSRRGRAIMNICQESGAKKLAAPLAGESEREEKENKGYDAPYKKPKATKKKDRQAASAVLHQKQPTVQGKSKTLKKRKAEIKPASSKARKFTSETSSLNESFAGEKVCIPRLVVTNPAATDIVVSPLPDGNAHSMSYHLMMEDELDKKHAPGPSPVAFAAGTNVEQQRTLKRSFQNNIQEASKYIEMIVGKPATSTAETTAPAVVPPRPEKSLSQLLEEERFQQFGHIFSKAMRRNDGEISEDLLVATINSSNDPSEGLKSFSKEEVLRFTSQLVRREKVYHSDGVYYLI